MTAAPRPAWLARILDHAHRTDQTRDHVARSVARILATVQRVVDEHDEARRALAAAEATTQRLREILRPLLDSDGQGISLDEVCLFCRVHRDRVYTYRRQPHKEGCPVLEREVLLGRSDAGGAGPGRAGIVHLCPPDGSGRMPCCGRTPFEASATDRMTRDAALVTCRGASTKEGHE